MRSRSASGSCRRSPAGPRRRGLRDDLRDPACRRVDAPSLTVIEVDRAIDEIESIRARIGGRDGVTCSPTCSGAPPRRRRRSSGGCSPASSGRARWPGRWPTRSPRPRASRRDRAPGADAVGRSHADGADRDDRGRGGPARDRLRDLPADPSDARLDRRRRGRGDVGLRAVLRGVEARRNPDPDPSPRPRRPHLHAQPQRDHGDVARDRRGGPAPSPWARRCSTARRCGWTTGPGGVPGHRVADRQRRPAGGHRDVPVRSAPPRRRGPSRHAVDERAAEAAGDRAAAGDPGRPDRGPGGGTAGAGGVAGGRPRGRGRQGRRVDLRRRPARRGVAEGQAGRTYDLVVLAAEWGHGRRQGWLSNLHLGARDPGSGELRDGREASRG